MQSNQYVLAGLGVGVVIAAGLFVFFAGKSTAPGTNATSTPQLNVIDDNGVSLGVTGSSTATVGSAGGSTVQPPALRAVVFNDPSLPEEAKPIIMRDYNNLAAQIKAAPDRVDLWLRLGVIYKMGGDYQGAAAAWIYVSKAAPSSVAVVAHGNLGDLYLNFTREYAKSEASFKAALALQPDNADFKAGVAAAQKAQGK